MSAEPPFVPLDPRKFRDPARTASGAARASVALTRLETLWFNTGTLCNIACAHCYIESSPTNDQLVYLTTAEVGAVLDEAAALERRPRTVGFTGGEPFLNPQIAELIELGLARGHDVLVLTNAMRPMMRPRLRQRLAELARGGAAARLTLRVSLDHWRAAVHDAERGAGSFAETLAGLRWLRDYGLRLAVAGRLGTEHEAALRAGYAALFAREQLAIDAADPAALVLFPEMAADRDVPEITVDCWRILRRDPAAVMCASSRMVVKRRGAAAPAVVACTLLPYDPRFELAPTLAGALGPVALNHPHCARFCVLGGASCQAPGG
ncbi:MAG: radical SAM protein [Deltaproteobacteria bacterium]|nr:radical SAM protein [Deltaproteobacteria bacterium]